METTAQVHFYGDNMEHHVWVFVPLVHLGRSSGSPALLEGSHHDFGMVSDLRNCHSHYPEVPLGSALMYDARMRAVFPKTGGSVLQAVLYDLKPDTYSRQRELVGSGNWSNPGFGISVQRNMDNIDESTNPGAGNNAQHNMAESGNWNIPNPANSNFFN